MFFAVSIGQVLALSLALTSPFALGYSGPYSIEEFRKQLPYHTPPADHRPKTYIRASRNETDDVSSEFLRGLKKANKGGTLVLPQNQTFVIGKKLDLSFLKDVHVHLEGKILFTDNIKYWQKNHFYHPFQESISFWKWGGKDVKIYGSGILDGNGQAWWDEFARHTALNSTATYLRPILFYAEKTTNLLVEGIRFQDSPMWTNFVDDSNNVVYDNVIIENISKSKNRPKNTDGWDSYNVDGMIIRDSWINTGDDCYSAKPNTSNILIENIFCNGTHGISMGSVGQYKGVKDYIYNGHFQDITMMNGANGARLKVWAGQDAGYGYINNITFKNFYIENVDWVILLDACYQDINTTLCAKYPSEVDMTNISFSNFTGSGSGSKGRRIGSLQCSPNAVCENITLDDIEITNPKGPPIIVCQGIAGGVGDCVPPNSTFKLAS
ncbi:Pectin lyase-like protein [Diplocarpon rosae]|nr:Pectin lyase-like protein [Diplocarpon rosae]